MCHQAVVGFIEDFFMFLKIIKVINERGIVSLGIIQIDQTQQMTGVPFLK